MSWVYGESVSNEGQRKKEKIHDVLLLYTLFVQNYETGLTIYASYEMINL